MSIWSICSVHCVFVVKVSMETPEAPNQLTDIQSQGATELRRNPTFP